MVGSRKLHGSVNGGVRSVNLVRKKFVVNEHMPKEVQIWSMVVCSFKINKTVMFGKLDFFFDLAIYEMKRHTSSIVLPTQ